MKPLAQREDEKLSRDRGVFIYGGELYPDYLKNGNGMQFIEPTARQFCKGKGVDVGAGKWPLPGALPVDAKQFNHATFLPRGPWDFIFSSHCLEHLIDPVAALEHWRDRLKKDRGVVFLYLPHPDQKYWRPQFCRKHLHLFWPRDVATMLEDLGFVDVMHGERDLMWSFAVVGFTGAATA